MSFPWLTWGLVFGETVEGFTWCLLLSRWPFFMMLENTGALTMGGGHHYGYRPTIIPRPPPLAYSVVVVDTTTLEFTLRSMYRKPWLI